MGVQGGGARLVSQMGGQGGMPGGVLGGTCGGVKECWYQGYWKL